MASKKSPQKETPVYVALSMVCIMILLTLGAGQAFLGSQILLPKEGGVPGRAVDGDPFDVPFGDPLVPALPGVLPEAVDITHRWDPCTLTVNIAYTEELGTGTDVTEIYHGANSLATTFRDGAVQVDGFPAGIVSSEYYHTDRTHTTNIFLPPGLFLAQRITFEETGGVTVVIEDDAGQRMRAIQISPQDFAQCLPNPVPLLVLEQPGSAGCFIDAMFQIPSPSGASATWVRLMGQVTSTGIETTISPPGFLSESSGISTAPSYVLSSPGGGSSIRVNMTELMGAPRRVQVDVILDPLPFGTPQPPSQTFEIPSECR